MKTSSQFSLPARATLIASVFFVMACVVSLSVNARPGMGGHWLGERGDPLERLERMADHLDLDEEQQAGIADILNSAMQQTAADRERMHQLQEETSLLVENFDAGRAQQLTEQMAELGARLAYVGLETHARVRSLLTPEQQAKVETLKKRREQRRERWGHR